MTLAPPMTFLLRRAKCSASRVDPPPRPVDRAGATTPPVLSTGLTTGCAAVSAGPGAVD